MFSEFPVVAATAAWSFSYLSAVPGIADVACLDAVQLRTALVRCIWRRTSSQRIVCELVVLFSLAVLSHGCSLGMTLDEVSLIHLGCCFSSSA
jgi:hypothetical protein